MTLLGMSTNLKTFDLDSSGYLVPNALPEFVQDQANTTKAENSYVDMNRNNKINSQLVKDEGYIEISNSKRQLQISEKKPFDSVRYIRSPGQNSHSQSREDDMEDSDYTEIFFKNKFMDREPIFNKEKSNPKLVSINVLLFVLILLLAVPVVYLFVVIQGQNRTLALYEGKIKLLENELVTIGAQSNDRDQAAYTYNSSADCHKLSESLEVLAQITFTKIDVNSKITTVDTRTALHVTAKEGQYDRVNFLISHGANLEAKDLSGFTPLQLAALYRHVDVINLLLDKGAMVDGINSLNKTALFFAIRNNCLSCVELLLKRGADVNHRDSLSTTPLDFANQNKYQDIIRVIQSYMEKNTTRLL